MAEDTIAEGFPRETLMHVSIESVKAMQQLPLCRALYVTDAGHFPEAKYHKVNRPDGCPNYILIFCLGGNGYIKMHNKNEAVEEGQAFLIPADTAHEYGSIANGSWRLYWAHFNGSEAEGLYQTLSNNGEDITLFLSNPAPISKAFENTIRWVQRAQTINALISLSGSVANLFGILSDLKRSKVKQVRLAEERIRNTIITMEQTLRIPMTLEQLSEEALMSVPYYCSLFKKQTGSTPMQVYAKLRIKAACQLLGETQLTVKEVAAEVGYDDAYYFSRAFKKVMGMSPSHYRGYLGFI